MARWRAENPDLARAKYRQDSANRRQQIIEGNRQRFARMTTEEKRDYWRAVRARQKAKKLNQVVSTM